MTALTIELQDELVERAQAEARRRNMTVEELAALGLKELLAKPDAEFERIARRIIEEDRELLRRLA